MRKILSSVLKLCIFGCAFYGVAACFGSVNAFMGNGRALLYFTIQSNIWIALFSLFGFAVLLSERIKGRSYYGRKMQLFSLVFTVSISLTGFVYSFILAPTIPGGWSLPNLILHAVVPLLSVLDFFVCPARIPFKRRDTLFTLIPPLYYVLFASVGYICNWRFGDTNYPYFFLNWGSPAGAFGFSRELPFIGVVWWIAVLGLFVAGVGLLFLRISNRLQKKK